MKILLIEDDEVIADLVKTGLEEAHFTVDVAYDGSSGLQYALDGEYALIVLDVMLPGVDGLDLTRHLRDSHQTVPILMMSARGRVDDRIRGLVEGADDYLAKPFSPAELVVRVNALLRRSAPGDLPTAMLRHRDLEVDLDRHAVRLEGKHVNLTDVEFRLLVAVLEANGRVLTRNHLIDSIYGIDRDVLGRTVDVTVQRIRAKLGDDPDSPRYIATVRGVGYRAAPESESQQT